MNSQCKDAKMMRFVGIAAVLLISGALAPAAAQVESEGLITDTTFTVQNVEGRGELVRVPVNKSVMVKFASPVKEVRLAKPEFAEVTAISPTQILVTGKAFGTTQLIAWFTADEQRVLDVAVDLELERLMASIREAVPRSNVKAIATLDAVILRGRAPDAESAERILEIAGVFSPRVINQLKVAGTQQVLLRCTVAEVNRSAMRKLGVNGFLAGDNFSEGFITNNIGGINPSNIGAAADALVTRNIPFLTGEDGIPITDATTLSFGFPRVQMQIFVQALRENGLMRILAEPNLVSMNGQPASFLAGGEIPIPVATQDRISILWKEFGVRLNFTPNVLSEERIRLEVAPEISEIDSSSAVVAGGFTIPGFTTRRVSTTVELGSGQTLAIGGLLNERVRSVVSRVPGLGDLPVLGALFRSVDYRIDETELVVLVTPELVDPISPNQVTYVPGSNYRVPNDFELFMLGEIDTNDGRESQTLKPRVNQSWPAKPNDLYGPQTALKLRGPLGPSGGAEGL